MTYPRGTLAMAKTSAPNSGGSQFFLVYADSTLPAGLHRLRHDRRRRPGHHRQGRGRGHGQQQRPAATASPRPRSRSRRSRSPDQARRCGRGRSCIRSPATHGARPRTSPGRRRRRPRRCAPRAAGGPRCFGSPISKVNRETATRSREVCTDAERMLTFSSASTLRDVREQPVPVQRLHLDRDEEHRRRRHRPRDVDQPLGPRLQVAGVRAVRAVHAHPAAAGDEARGCRRPAPACSSGRAWCRAVQRAVRAAHHTPASPARLALADRRRRGALGELLLGVLHPAEQRDQPLHDVPRRDVALPDGGVEPGQVREVQLARQRRHRVGRARGAAAACPCAAPPA